MAPPTNSQAIAGRLHLSDPIINNKVVNDAETALSHRGFVYWLILAIAAITLVTGLVQIVIPGFVLALVGANRDPTSEQLFATIGMFMAIFGAMLFQALRSSSNQRIVVFWAALQKFGASIAVFIGVQKHIYSGIAPLIATFDGISGCLIFWYWTRMRPRSVPGTSR
jgi:hypothetical protein